MIARTPPPWLSRAYAVALVVHGCTVVLVIGLAVFFGMKTGANAAPDTLFFSLVMMIPVLLFAVPSVFALLSWHLCRKRGWVPSPGHKGLTVVAAVLLLVFLAVVLLK